MTSPFNHPLDDTAILFFKIIVTKHLEDGKLKMPNNFTKKYGGGLSNPVFLKPPDATEWKIYWTKHDDGGIWFQNGWKEFTTYYSLDHGHLVLFEYDKTSHFKVHLFDMTCLEIKYPSSPTGTSGEKDIIDLSSDDDSVEILDEKPACKNSRLKSPISSPQPHKKLKTCTTRDVERNSTGNQSQGATFASVKKGLESEVNMGGSTQLPKVEQLSCTKNAEALKRAKKFRSKNPFFMLVMKPSYVNGPSSSIPLHFAGKYLKKKRKTIHLHVGDGRTWPVGYSHHKFNTGWKKFVCDNNLNLGDVCVFELTNRRDISLKVLIFRATIELYSPQSKVQGEEPNLLDPGRIVYVESKTDVITSKGDKEIRRTSLLISPNPAATNGAVKAEKFTSENPFFIVNLRQSFFQQRPLVPTAFIRKYLNNKQQIVMLQFEKKLWPVKLLFYPKKRTSGKLSCGWSLFAGEIKLKVGDVCIFELIKREDDDTAVLDVHVFRSHGYA